MNNDTPPPVTANPNLRQPLHFATVAHEQEEQEAVAAIVALALADAVEAFAAQLHATNLLPDELMFWLMGDLTGMTKGSRKVARGLLRMANLEPTEAEVAAVLVQREDDFTEALAEDNGI